MNKLKAIKHPIFTPLRYPTIKSAHIMTLPLLWLTSLLPLNVKSTLKFVKDILADVSV